MASNDICASCGQRAGDPSSLFNGRTDPLMISEMAAAIEQLQNEHRKLVERVASLEEVNQKCDEMETNATIEFCDRLERLENEQNKALSQIETNRGNISALHGLITDHGDEIRKLNKRLKRMGKSEGPTNKELRVENARLCQQVNEYAAEIRRLLTWLKEQGKDDPGLSAVDNAIRVMGDQRERIAFQDSHIRVLESKINKEPSHA